jgi:hypothetical protein
MRVSILALLLTLSSVPATAAAAAVPPGNSGADQYAEAFPTSGGNEPSVGRGNQAPASKALGKENADRLESAGDDGRSTAALAAKTDPAGREMPRDGTAQKKAPAAGARSGGDGFDEVAKRALGSPDSDGTGLLLPIILALTLILATTALVFGRRRGSSS